MKKSRLFLVILLCLTMHLNAQYPVIKGVPVTVKFNEKVRDWDGFGFNYVETAQTPDYKEYAQEYGGFSLLDEQQKNEIIEMVFGEDGLKVGLVKMFYDPFHQTQPGGSTTTKQRLKTCANLYGKDWRKHARIIVICRL